MHNDGIINNNNLIDASLFTYMYDTKKCFTTCPSDNKAWYSKHRDELN